MSEPLSEKTNLSPELKAKWIAALRSGEYEQGIGRLYFEGAYCCLGVLGELAGLDRKRMDGICSLAVVAPTLVDAMCGSDPEETTRTTLENMNDGMYGQRRHSFAEIADWIEANL